MENYILNVNSVTKKFGGLVALEKVSLNIKRGEVFGLIGPNGAGKTTLFNIIAGVYKANEGNVVFNGKDITRFSPNKRCKTGIARTFQITKPFGALTVLENVCIGALFGTSHRSPLLSRHALDKAAEESVEVLKFLGLDHKKDALADTLNVPERKRLELCRALATKPDLLLLDEVIAGLNPSEVDGMVDQIRQISKRGITILMIEHIMKAVMNVSDDITVLNFGKVIAECKPNEIMNHQCVVDAYLGQRRGTGC